VKPTKKKEERRYSAPPPLSSFPSDLPIQGNSPDSESTSNNSSEQPVLEENENSCDSQKPSSSSQLPQSPPPKPPRTRRSSESSAVPTSPLSPSSPSSFQPISPLPLPPTVNQTQSTTPITMTTLVLSLQEQQEILSNYQRQLSFYQQQQQQEPHCSLSALLFTNTQLQTNLVTLSQLSPSALAYLTRLGVTGRQAEEQMNYLRSQPSLLEFYFSFVRSLSRVIIASQCIFSGFIQDNRSSTAENITSLFSFFLSSSSLPGAEMISGVCVFLVKYIHESERKKSIQRLLKTFPTNSSLEWIEILGRMVTIALEEEILRHEAEELQRKSQNTSKGIVERVFQTLEWLQDPSNSSKTSVEVFAEAKAGLLLERVMREEKDSTLMESVEGNPKKVIHKFLNWMTGRTFADNEEGNGSFNSQVTLFPRNIANVSSSSATEPVSPSSPSSLLLTEEQLKEMIAESSREESHRLSLEIGALKEKISKLEEISSCKRNRGNTDSDLDIDISHGNHGSLLQQRRSSVKSTTTTSQKGEERNDSTDKPTILENRFAVLDDRLVTHVVSTREKLEELQTELERMKYDHSGNNSKYHNNNQTSVGCSCCIS
jgi:hypothetical protein